ncbi:MAG: hypothetical protein HYW26_01475 [Candidatus Aenigmarchaeota archaeon]|nr:hypothetical protein [Candidatus Aenigmarchaeota archaeon]
MEEEMLLEIKKAEEKAEEIVREAEKRKGEMIREAGLEAARYREREIEKLKKQSEELIARESEKISARSRAMIKKAEEDAKNLGPDKRKSEEAKNYLKKEFRDLF